MFLLISGWSYSGQQTGESPLRSHPRCMHTGPFVFNATGFFRCLKQRRAGFLSAGARQLVEVKGVCVLFQQPFRDFRLEKHRKQSVRKSDEKKRRKKATKKSDDSSVGHTKPPGLPSEAGYRRRSTRTLTQGGAHHNTRAA